MVSYCSNCRKKTRGKSFCHVCKKDKKNYDEKQGDGLDGIKI